MKIFISIVSHLHHDVIINLGTIKRLRKYGEVQVVCRDNSPVEKLQLYCEKYNAIYLPNPRLQGFSTNNNQNFLYCKDHLGMKSSDMFILLNPDIFINNEAIVQLLEKLKEQPTKLATCNLYLDREHMVQDDNIRIYPKFLNFIKTYLFNDRTTMVSRDKGLEVSDKHWASCSFMIVDFDLYLQLNGLDESYYMYCEDIDFCYRAKIAGYQFSYFDLIKAVHFRRRDSKRFLSEYFFWHVGSVLKYSFRKKKLQAKKSCLKSNVKSHIKK